jgi:O-Antigen ligase
VSPSREEISWRADPPGVVAWIVPVVLILYLGLANGGYGPIARAEVGVAVWWTVLIGTALNVLPPAAGTKSGRMMLIVLAAFAAWTALSLTWTESDERTATEVARVSAYLGVFTLALAAQGTGRWRQLLFGVTTAIAVLCALAVLSRMHPPWFPEQTAGRYLTGIDIERRLAYPLNYPSGLGALAAIGLPLSVAATSLARSIPGKALAAASIPVLALTLWLTTSSLSLPVAVIALGAFLLLAPDRLPKLGTVALAGVGSAILFAAVEQREALDRGLPTPTAIDEGHELLLITLVVCLGVGLVQAGSGLWLRLWRRPAWLQISRRSASIAAAGTLAAALALAVAVGLPRELGDQWDTFKSRGAATDPTQATRGAQIVDFSGSGRYDFWESAVDANATDPWRGIGPGTFEFWWLRNGTYSGYTRDAHSLYVETLAELGIVGLVLIAGFSVAILIVGGARALRAPPELRLGIAAATAGCTAFVGAALVDWIWELGVLPVVFFVLAAVAVAAGVRAAPSARIARTQPRWREWAPRLAIVALSLAALAAIVPPLFGSVAIQRSYDAAAEGRVADALEDAHDAESMQPYAAGPRLQEALLLFRRGDAESALQAAREATQRERTNWRNWYVLSQIEAEQGMRDEAARDLQRARALNPFSPVLGN